MPRNTDPLRIQNREKYIKRRINEMAKKGIGVEKAVMILAKRLFLSRRTVYNDYVK